MTHTATDKRNALRATTKAEQKIAARIAALPQDSDETQDLLDTVTNIWIIDLVDILRAEKEATQ